MGNKMKKALISVCSLAILSSSIFTSVACSGSSTSATSSLSSSNSESVNLIPSGSDYEWSSVDSSIKETYVLGETVNIPKRILTVGGVPVTAKSIVEYPNGATTLNTTVKLDKTGNYKIVYTAHIAGKTYLEECEFFVNGVQASVQSEKSSLSYGAYEYNVDRMALVDSTTGQTERQQYTHTCEEGLMVRLARGDTLTFNEIIDLSNATETDSLIKAFATPDEQGSPDFEKLIFTFTDIYDPSITLTFISQHTQEGYDYRKTYNLVAGNGQKASGVDFMDPNKMYVEKWGTSGDGSYTRRFKPVYQNADGVWVDDYKEQDAMPIDFRFDNATKTAYLRDYRNAVRVNKIADLDEPEHFATLWQGFTDGKVRLSISADVYSADTANFCVTHVIGLDLTKTAYTDTEKAIISIDNHYDTMPTAVVGGEYPVPTATAFDLNVGECTVQTSVWYNYTSNNPQSISIKDGKFKTEKYGDYAIVYEANDGNGNIAKEILWVFAEKTLPQMQVNFIGDYTTETVCGAWIVPAEYEIANAVGDGRDVSVSVKATLNGEEIQIDDGFRVEKYGEYKIIYTVTDYIGRTAETSYTLTVNKGTEPVFIEDPNLPFAFISGKEYVMPTVYASDYTNGSLTKRLAYAELTDKNGTRRIECGAKFVPVVEKQGDFVQIVYKYDYQGQKIVSETYSIPTVMQMGYDANNNVRLFVANYLLGDGFATKTTKDKIVIEATESEGGWTYAKDLLAENFSIRLCGEADESYFDGLYITLTDAENKKEQVSIYVQNLSNSIMFYMGDDTLKINKSFHNGEMFTLGYEQGAIVVDSTKINVKTYDTQQPFAGFTSQKILLSVSFVGAKAGAKYSIRMLCDEIVGTSNRDSSSPAIVVLGDYGGIKKIGETVELPKAVAGDLLDPNISFTVSVICPDATIATDVDGKQLKDVSPDNVYSISLQQYGQYMVNYIAADSVGNENSYSYVIYVKDETPPTLTFTGTTSAEAKVGDTLVLPTFSVADNLTETEKLEINKSVCTPSGTLYTLSQTGNSIVCAQVGVYEFRIMVIDEEGNVALYTYAVTVTK